eukprot:scaffold23596_cov91-Skeletonema_dohrnii-CCMP3373.AAC.4
MMMTIFFFIFIFTLLTNLWRIGGVAAAMPSTAPHHRRKAQGNFNVPGTNGGGGGGGGWQWQGCGPSQCYRQDYGQCFHATSYECTNPIEFVAATPPPTKRLVTPRIQTEIPILFQLLNVDGEYIFSSSDRTKFLSKIRVRALLDEELDDSWEIISVESLGEYSARRLTLTTSSLRGWNTRRLNKTLYIQVIVTLRGREDMSDMARLFILQALRSKLNTLLMYIKSLNANAFRSLQLSVNELILADVVEVEAGRPTPTVGIQSTSTNAETIRSTETKTSVEAPSTGTPFWVWLIVATVCIPLGICLLLCMCRAGWCLCCTDCGGGGCFKRKRDTNTREDYERQIQSVTESRRQYYARRTRSDVMRKYDERGRGDNGRRRHGERRRGIGKWRRTRSDSNIIYYQSDRPRPSRSRPMAKRSLSMMMDKEIALAEMNIIEGGIEAETKQDEPVAVVAALPLPASFPTQNRGKDTPAPVEYENALVVYGDEQIGLTLEPEGPKIEDLPQPGSNALSLVTFNPPKDPEGELCTETPRRRSLREL